MELESEDYAFVFFLILLLHYYMKSLFRGVVSRDQYLLVKASQTLRVRYFSKNQKRKGHPTKGWP